MEVEKWPSIVTPWESITRLQCHTSQWVRGGLCQSASKADTYCTGGRNRPKAYGQQVIDGLQGNPTQNDGEKPSRAYVWPTDPFKTAEAATKSLRESPQGGKADSQGAESQAEGICGCKARC